MYEEIKDFFTNAIAMLEELYPHETYICTASGYATLEETTCTLWVPNDAG
jgi:hypothetical protein